MKDSEERMIAKNRKYRCGQPGQEADIPVPTDIPVSGLNGKECV